LPYRNNRPSILPVILPAVRLPMRLAILSGLPLAKA